MKGQRFDVSTPKEYLAALDEPRRAEVKALDAFIRKTVPKLKPYIHAGMLAYGKFRYRTKAGKESDWFKVGISSNKAAISLYCCASDEQGYVAERYQAALPKASIGKTCVRIKRFEDLELRAFAKLLKETEKKGFGA